MRALVLPVAMLLAVVGTFAWWTGAPPWQPSLKPYETRLFLLALAPMAIAATVLSARWRAKGPGWFALAAALSWGAFLVGTGVMMLTPLCVGQENGDGINGVGECVFYAVGGGAFWSVLAAIPVSAATFAAWRIVRKG